MNLKFTAQQLASFLNGTIEGNPDISVTGFSKIEEGEPGMLSFLANPKYTEYIYNTKASIILVNDSFVPEHPISATLVRVKDAYSAISQLLSLVEMQKPRKQGIAKNAFISENAKLGDNLYIGASAYIGSEARIGNNVQIYPNSYIGDNVVIADDVIVYPNVTIYDRCRIGSRCILHAGCVIGADGFGFAPQSDGSYEKIPQIGNVILEDDVEVGANTCIDRATMGSTRISSGVKLDNLIQIAHNVVVGKDTVMAAQTGIAGSAKIGQGCIMGGQVGIAGHLRIGNKVQVGPQAGISSSVDDKEKVMGTPAIPYTRFMRSSAVFSKLPDMYRDLNAIKKEIDLSDKKERNN